MISNYDRVITQLLPAIYTNKSEPTVMRFNIDKILHVLGTEKYNLSNRYFEDKLVEMATIRFQGKSFTHGLRYAAAVAILNLADKMHVSDQAIVKYLSEHQSEQDAKEIQEKIEVWRKNFYGSLPRDQKQAILEQMSEKLRPEVLEQIRRA